MMRHELLEADRGLVLVIDLQGRLLEMTHRWQTVVTASRRLIELAAIFGRPVVLSEQYPQGLGPTHAEIRSAFDALDAPKRLIEKVSFGCCGDSGFGEAVEEMLSGVPVERRQFVVAGIEAHVCVMQTVVELLRTGGQVHVCWDCVTSRGEEYRRHALDRMQQAGACITNHESVAFEWARSKDHPGFRAMSRMLRDGQPV